MIKQDPRAGRVTTRSRLRDRTARQSVCHPPFLAESRRALRPLRAASGIRGKGLRLLRRVSSRRRGKVAGFRGGGPPLLGERVSAQNRASWVARAFWGRLNSRDRLVSSDIISDSAHKSKLIGRLGRCV